VIVITSEYSTGAIRSSLLAVPRRLPMLAAKVTVFALLEFVVSAITVFTVFFIGTVILGSHISITIGGLIRHTAGAIATVIALVLVIPPLISLIPGTVADHIHGYLPAIAGQLAGQTTQQPADVLSPWQGFGVFCAWTVVLLAASAWLLVRRDA
jgi:ABC-2 type transport system permease protein